MELLFTLLALLGFSQHSPPPHYTGPHHCKNGGIPPDCEQFYPPPQPPTS